MESKTKESTMSTDKGKLSNTPSDAWSEHEKELSRQIYGCEIIQQRCNKVDSENLQLPNDAYIISYIHEDKIYHDITRGNKQVDLFDMYYDKFGNDLKSIEWTKGRVNPRVWGYKPPEKKKRK